MKPREREALFRQMKRWGVTSYREGDVSVQFGDLTQSESVRQVCTCPGPAGTPHERGCPAYRQAIEADDLGQLDLPSGVIDPRAKLAEIYSKRGKRAA